MHKGLTVVEWYLIAVLGGGLSLPTARVQVGGSAEP